MFWGGAIVIFLAKIINFHNANTQGFWVEVSSQVETGILNIRLKYRSSDFSISRVVHCHQYWLHPLASIRYIQLSTSASLKKFNTYIYPVFRNMENLAV